MTVATTPIRQLRKTVLIAATTAMMTAPVVAADPQNGHDLAAKWCAACHVVENDQSAASADVPSFEGISNRADFDAESLKVFLIDPHPKMPNMNLSRLEIEDLVAYIGSLKN